MLARLYNLQTCLLDAELSVAHQKYAALAAEVRCLQGVGGGNCEGGFVCDFLDHNFPRP